MIELIRDLPLSELLSISDLPAEDLDPIYHQFSEILLAFVFNRLEVNPLWDESQKQEAKAFIDANFDKEDMLDLLKEKYTDFESIFESETYLCKKNMLLEQIEEDKSLTFSNITPEEQEDWQYILENLANIIESENNNDFEIAWMEYIDFKINK